MNPDASRDESLNVEHIVPTPSTFISDQLPKMSAMLKQACPSDAVIRFEYDGQLRVHIDVRRFEDMAQVESMLPSLCGGIFGDVQRGLAKHHSFFHRVSALVAR